MAAKIPVEGQRFNLLTMIEREPSKPGYALCECDCGVRKSVKICHVRSGRTISCGCEHSRRASARTAELHASNIKHGASHTRVHGLWSNMKARCYRPSSSGYKRYNGRGITVCDRWMVFTNFLADMGEPPEGMTIERIDNDGPYSPDNCRWATRKEQANNTSANVYATIDGETKSAGEWSAEYGLPRKLLRDRVHRGESGVRLLRSKGR